MERHITSDKDTAVERYEMLLNHSISHDGNGPLSVVLLNEDTEFYQFEVFCEAVDIVDGERTPCEWWDHWDERKEDLNGS